MVILENESGFAADFDLHATAEAVTEAVLSGEHCPGENEIELLITDAESVHQMNRDFRGIDRTTDVLSFPNVDWEAPADYENANFQDPFLINPETGARMLGQIVLNEEKIVSQAQEYGHPVRREYAFLIAHSLLHLLGYDHETIDEAAQMEQKQEAYLNAVGILR